MSRRPLRVAVVGAGPSGVYTTAALAEQQSTPVEVHVLDRLPTPFGLVRYGVAPDHTSIRDVRETLRQLLEHPNVRFTGNVEVGRDITLDELRGCVDAVVLTYGAATDRTLGIPGEGLDGSLAATELVSWYCGHPDADRGRVERLLSRARSVVVIGVGNVALDVTRILARTPSELERTDMPQHVLDTLARSSIRDVHLVGRRSPARASFTSKELRELGNLPGVDVLLDPADLQLDPVETQLATDAKPVSRNLAILAQWAQRPRAGHPRRINLHFWARPQRLLGTDRVEGIVLERMTSDGRGGVVATGKTAELAADVVVRSVGYRSLPLDGVPFDAAANVIPNDHGRVLRDGRPSPGEYVAGWVKRGPSGVIGTNKGDAQETVAALLADAQELVGARPHHRPDLAELLCGRQPVRTSMVGWRLIDAAEVALGESRGRARTTLHERQHLLTVGREPDAPAPPESAFSPTG